MGMAFYVPDGDRFVSTEWTRGPWDPRYQHAGPPAALLGRAIEALEPADGFMVARFTVEVLRSIPLSVVTAEAHLARPGKRVQLAEATLSDEDGDIAVARAWRIRRVDTSAEQSAAEPGVFAGPDAAAPSAEFDPWGGPSYFSAVQWRVAAGDFLSPGPATVWMRMNGALVDGEEPSPLTRVLVAADSGNGVSMELPLETHVFINTELSVHIFREPAGEWVCLDARTRIGPGGAGLATSTLFDATGRFGTANQALLVSTR
ncbi:MAG: thioesterase family protein [Candidatus Dormibacteraeota bacterium]|uniref:Thioesterase family protein n=1 Tax=Candidatus Aeolococcus gillhamiae TaxID=3127015 RepID=A0A934JXV0_9BACT|nr:thioesterase family protein [Candidatus Dormibacteraeota bacterium]